MSQAVEQRGSVSQSPITAEVPTAMCEGCPGTTENTIRRLLKSSAATLKRCHVDCGSNTGAMLTQTESRHVNRAPYFIRLITLLVGGRSQMVPLPFSLSTCGVARVACSFLPGFERCLPCDDLFLFAQELGSCSGGGLLREAVPLGLCSLAR